MYKWSHDSVADSFLLLSIVPRYVCPVVFFKHSPAIQGDFHFWLLQIDQILQRMLLTFMYKFLCEHKFSFSGLMIKNTITVPM